MEIKGTSFTYMEREKLELEEKWDILPLWETPPKDVCESEFYRKELGLPDIKH